MVRRVVRPSSRSSEANLDKTFVVKIGSDLYGESFGIGRRIGPDGVVVEMVYTPPLGSEVTVHFLSARDYKHDEIVWRTEVERLYHSDHFARLVGLRFVDVGARVVR